MPFPKPANGQVIRYSYLWRREYVQGQDEGVKDRPCAVVLVTTDEDGDDIVTALPITHTPPSDHDIELVIELPPNTKRRLGLDSERSWIVLTEANRFVWPGPDLVPARDGDASTVVYGLLPNAFYEKVRQAFLALLKTGKARTTKRAE